MNNQPVEIPKEVMDVEFASDFPNVNISFIYIYIVVLMLLCIMFMCLH